MDQIGSDKFALEAFTLTFNIQRIFQSRFIPPEAKERLAQDYSSLKEQVRLMAEIGEAQQTCREKVNRVCQFNL